MSTGLWDNSACFTVTDSMKGREAKDESQREAVGTCSGHFNSVQLCVFPH